MKINNSKLLIVVTTLLILSCSAVESIRINSASQHVLEPNDSFETIWNRLDIGLASDNRRSSMVGAPGKIVLIGSKTTGMQTGKVIGLDSLTGDIVWTSPGANLGEIISNGENVYRGTYGTATVQSINIENGKLLWQTILPFAHSTYNIYFAENKIFVHTNNANFYILNDQGKILDSFSEIDDVFLIMDDVLYMENVYGLKAVDFSSKEELWQLEAGTVYSYAPIFDDGTIFFRTAGDSADIYSIDQVTGEVNWKTTHSTLSNLYVTDDKIYFLNSDSYLVVLDKYSGDEILSLTFSPVFNLNEQSEAYFITGDPANNMLVLYFGDNSQILGLKILNP